MSIRYTREEAPAELVIGQYEVWDTVRDRFARWVRGVQRALLSTPYVDVVSVPFEGGTTDLDVAAPFRVSAVLLGGARRADGGVVGTGVTMDWAATNDGYRVRSVAGLTAGTAYVLTLVAMGGE